jgi:hypothetical protein
MVPHRSANCRLGDFVKELDFICHVVAGLDDFFEDIDIGFRSQLMVEVVERVNKIRLAVTENNSYIADSKLRDGVNKELRFCCDMVGLVNNYSDELFEGTQSMMLQLAIGRLQDLFKIQAVAA